MIYYKKTEGDKILARVMVAGGVNLDIGGIPNNKVIMNDSNAGKITYSFGGVGRNIAHNMSLLGLDVSLMSALSNDMFGKNIQESLGQLKIDTTLSFVFDHPTSTYLFVADGEGDMLTAVNDMSIQDFITPELVQTRLESINESDFIVLDTNLRQDTLEYILDNAKKKVLVDGVSTTKALKVLKKLDKIYLLKVNIYEAEYLSGVKIKNKTDMQKAVDILRSTGLEVLVISLGSRGVAVSFENQLVFLDAIETKVVNATGAGDAMLGGIVYGLSQGYDLVKSIQCGVCASHIALIGELTVNEKMSAQYIEKLLNNK